MIREEILSRVIKKSKCWCGVRHLQAVMLFFAIVCSSCTKSNMGIAIVAMTDPSKNNGEDGQLFNTSDFMLSLHGICQTFDWSLQTQSMILSSFKWGYVVTLIPAGALLTRVGGMQLTIYSITVKSVLEILLPTAAFYGGWQFVCACRVIEGLAQGLLFPAVSSILVKWSPLEEKSRMGVFVFAGTQLGDGFQMAMSGLLAARWGWPSIFYVYGVFGLIWTLIYLILGSNSPYTSKIISVKERQYIANSLKSCIREKPKTPWKAMCTSMAFWAPIIAICGMYWGYFTLMTELPTYMSNILDLDIKTNGVLSAVPYLIGCLMCLPFGFLSDYVLKKKWLSLTACRKLCDSLACFVPAALLITLSYVPANEAVTVVLLSIAMAFGAAHYAGSTLVHLDVAPNFVGQMTGIAQFCASITSLFAPFAAAALLEDKSNPSDWRKVFFVASAVYVACNCFYLALGTSERQRWNDADEDQIDITTENK